MLGVEGPRFTVDGAPRFLLVVSYFDALRASDATLAADFAWLRRHGIDGVRIFPTGGGAPRSGSAAGTPATTR